VGRPPKAGLRLRLIENLKVPIFTLCWAPRIVCKTSLFGMDDIGITFPFPFLSFLVRYLNYFTHSFISFVRLPDDLITLSEIGTYGQIGRPVSFGFIERCGCDCGCFAVSAASDVQWRHFL
jgi:hypothetical protein